MYSADWPEAYHGNVETDTNPDKIFYWELYAVCAAIQEAAARPSRPRRLVVRCDNENVCAIFNSMRALPTYNRLLMYAVDVLIESGIDLRVLRVAGVDNVIADPISRNNFELALTRAPNLVIIPFALSAELRAAHRR